MKGEVTSEAIRHFRASKDEVCSLFRDLYLSCVNKYGYAIASAALNRFVNFDFELSVRIRPCEFDEIDFLSSHAPVGDIPVKP